METMVIIKYMKEELEDKYFSIKCDYKKALTFIKKNDYKTAKRVLYEDMKPELYDLSLDILYNRNNEFSDNELRNLVVQVDTLLNKSDNNQFETDLLDDYNGNF